MSGKSCLTLVLTAIAGLAGVGHATAFDVTWPGAYHTWGQSVEQTRDGGYIVGAQWRMDSATGYVALIKTDSLGDTIWTRRFPAEQGGQACLTANGGFVVIGTRTLRYPRDEGIVVKVGPRGDSLWEFVIADYECVWPGAISPTRDGGCIVGGQLNDRDYYMWLLKLDSSGREVWRRVYEKRFHMWDPASIEQTDDGGFFLSGLGWDDSCGNCHSVLATDSVGREVWSRTITRPALWGYAGVPTEDGYVVTGYGEGPMSQREANRTVVAGRQVRGYSDGLSESYWRLMEEIQSLSRRCVDFTPRGYAAYLTGLTNDGQIRWWQFFRPENRLSEAYSVARTADGGYIVCGQVTDLLDWKSQVYLVKADRLGRRQWEQVLGNLHTHATSGNCVRQTRDGGYVIVGSDGTTGIRLIKTDRIGRTEQTGRH
jgi:hypothetical protein